jgi:hypothetical protein
MASLFLFPKKYFKGFFYSYFRMIQFYGIIQRSQALRLLRIKEAETFGFALTSKIQNKLLIKPKTRNSVKPVLQEVFLFWFFSKVKAVSN